MSKKVDTVPKPLKCRFCKEEATLGTWMYEADEPEKMFMCHDCWNFITSLIEDALPSMFRDYLKLIQVQMRTREISVMRHVRVEEKPIEAGAK